MNNVDLKKIGTEKRNPNTMNIDKVSTTEILKLINNEDKTVPYAVEKEIDHIAKLVDCVVEQFYKDGRLIYVGAGTSGRIGLIDAVECRPTYSCSDEMVQCLMAGGMKAMAQSKTSIFVFVASKVVIAWAVLSGLMEARFLMRRWLLIPW